MTKSSLCRLGFTVVLVATLATAQVPGVVSLVLLTAPCEIREVLRTIRGDSLTPLARDGDRVKVQVGYYACHPVRHGDIVVHRYAPDRDPIIKIAKAIEGDRIALKPIAGDAYHLIVNGQITRNSVGEPCLLDVAAHRRLMLYINEHAGRVPPGALLILGDRATGSRDSSVFGLISVRDLVGKAELLRSP